MKKKFKAGDGYRLLFERIAQARAEGCSEDEVGERILSDREIQQAMRQEHLQVLTKEFGRYLKVKGLTQAELSEEQMKKICRLLFDASLRALIDDSQD